MHGSLNWIDSNPLRQLLIPMYRLYGMTDVGLVRTNNEDGFVFNHVLLQEGDYSISVKEPFWALVADGMGGVNAGEVASCLTLESFTKLERRIEEKEELKRLVELEIPQKLFQHEEYHPETKGMGTTLAGIVWFSERLFIFHIGDSRVYRWREPFLKPLTKDHSLVEFLYASGQISFEEKRTHPERHVLLRSLGQKNVEVDITDIPSLPELGDIFLLCSDGLTDVLTDEDIECVLNTTHSINEQAKRLVGMAKERGESDNITVVMAKCMNGKEETDGN